MRRRVKREEGEERRGVWSIKKESCSGGISMAAAMIRAFIQEIRDKKNGATKRRAVGGRYSDSVAMGQSIGQLRGCITVIDYVGNEMAT
jgi:hypothetical protein